MKRSELRRKSWMARGTKPLPRKPIARKSRKPSETRRIYGGQARIEFVKGLPCLICGRTPSDNAHVTNGGTGRKANAELEVPLCPDDPGTGWRGHHPEYDTGKRSFVAKYASVLQGLTMREHAALTEAAWQQHCAVWFQPRRAS